jgi:hypothetical protein
MFRSDVPLITANITKAKYGLHATAFLLNYTEELCSTFLHVTAHIFGTPQKVALMLLLCHKFKCLPYCYYGMQKIKILYHVNPLLDYATERC